MRNVRGTEIFASFTNLWERCWCHGRRGCRGGGGGGCPDLDRTRRVTQPPAAKSAKQRERLSSAETKIPSSRTGAPSEQAPHSRQQQTQRSRDEAKNRTASAPRRTAKATKRAMIEKRRRTRASGRAKLFSNLSSPFSGFIPCLEEVGQAEEGSSTSSCTDLGGSHPMCARACSGSDLLTLLPRAALK
jgi:hypothetical protein